MIPYYTKNKLNGLRVIVDDFKVGAKSVSSDFLKGASAAMGSFLFIPSAVNRCRDEYHNAKPKDYLFISKEILKDNIAKDFGAFAGLALIVKMAPSIYNSFKEHPLWCGVPFVLSNIASACYERGRKINKKRLEERL